MSKRALSVYRAKRDFSKTAEPSGQSRVAPSPRLRFVVQKHAARRLHYDLSLEFDGVFKSWAVTRGPSVDPADKRLAVEVEDHPLDYGDFEGTIPRGEYGGGTVQLWDRGYWIPEGAKSPQDAFNSGDLKFTLEGKRLRGSWVLVRMRQDRYGGKRTNWLLIKHKDAASQPDDADALLAEDRSVASGRSLAQIAEGVGKRPKPFMLAAKTPVRADAVWTAKPPPPSKPSATQREPVLVQRVPAFIEPQLTKLVDQPPDGSRWAHEVKLDGYRAQVRVADGRAVIRTRTGLDWTDRFAAIAADAEVQLRVGGLALLAGDAHQSPDAGLVHRDERVRGHQLALLVHPDELADVVAAEAERRLREVVRPEREELSRLGDLAGGHRGARELDHGSPLQVVELDPLAL
jgi:bifunctional non-homologous end joining protein LigD